MKGEIGLENSYRFFSNGACKYFPCHEVKDAEGFNCLFCYCPLYFLEDCGGHYGYFNKIKDCTNCMIPHSKNGYDYIVGKITKVNEAVRKERNA